MNQAISTSAISEYFCSLWELFITASNWSVENLLSALSIILVIIGGIFGYHQWATANKTKRFELLNQIIETIRFDEEMSEIMYLIDYDRWHYDISFHHNKQCIEFKTDKLLAYMSYICYLYAQRKLSKKEFRIVKYEIDRVCTSFSIQSYLWNLYHFSKSRKTECAFQYLIEYGIKNKLISKHNFYREASGIYTKYLNF